MDATLPAGCTWRRPQESDAEALHDFVSRYNTAVVGFADSTVDDIRDDLTDPGYAEQHDGWIVLDDAGAVVGWGWVSRTGTGHLVEIDVVAHDSTVVDWLFEQAGARALVLAREAGHKEVEMHHCAYRDDDAMRSHLGARGFEAATTYHRMRIDHHRPVAAPKPPRGLVLRPGPGDEAFRRAAHNVMTTAFAGQFGFTPEPFDDWHRAHEAQSTFDWSHLATAELAGEPVGYLERTDEFVDDEKCGYILRVGVLPEARGRGIARFLLQHAFAADALDGRAGTILHVDTNNTTPALRLYESVGMRPVLVIDVWRRPPRSADPVG